MPASPWQKSSYSNEEGNCVELAITPAARLLIRESDTPDTVLTASPARVRALLHRLKGPATDA
ncbi:DUF397 domain-containing protein [Streptomyces hainanensis]|uniref:DUF397 domain-containing protein n=1 Tax=Streptomyces hainanensis TaxID=402648 RepID=A0A4V2Y2V3_9ACTN|nr:DUF397 domain-containing protein [Streptomyces hainanensis]TDC74095.1 DUF397 domain-containing protein [Streptomyces hainanensis]